MNATDPIVNATDLLSLHFPLNTLALKRGGLVRSVMRRANELAASGAFAAVWIEVLAFQPRLDSDVAELKRSGHLHEGVQVRSVLYSLDPSSETDATTSELEKPTAMFDQPGLVAVPVRNEPLRVHFLRDGVLEHSVTRNGAGSLRFVDHFDAGRHRVTRDEYGSDGRVIRVLHYPPAHDQPTAARYIGRDGACFLTVWQEPGGPEWSQVHLLAPQPRQLSEMGELYQYAFERLLAGERSPVLFSDFHENLNNLPASNLDDVVRSVRHPRLRTVAMAHSNHHSVPYTSDSGVSENWDRLFANLDHWDLLVLLTDAQRRDVQAQYGDGARMRVIPPSAEPSQEPPGAVDPDRLVLVARTHPKKRVDEAVRAFRLVLDRRPNARLEIYGFGYGDSEERLVDQLIDDLDLRQHVRFVGFASRQSDIYDGACVSLLTSASEGFPLSLLESMAHSCPVIAYDASFGPRDAIIDDVNGYLVPFGDRAALADRIVSVMESAPLRERLGAGALSSLRRFSETEHLDLWVQALTDLDGPPAQRSYLRADYEVQAARCVDGELELHVGVPPDAASPHLLVRSRGGSEVRRVPVVAGRCRVSLDPCAPGDIFDFSLTAGPDASETRLAFGSPDVVQCDRYRIYATVSGSFSVKRVNPSATTDISVLTAGWEAEDLVVALNLPDGTDAQLVVRQRGREDEQHVVLQEGRARIALGSSTGGDIFDFWLRTPDGPDGHHDQRLAFGAAQVSQRPPYRIYGTAHGSFSVKHVVPSATSPVGVLTAGWEAEDLVVALDAPDGTDAQLVVRQRGQGDEQHVGLRDGRARIALGPSTGGDIFDFWLRTPDGPDGHHDQRLAFGAVQVSQRSPYRIYATAHGSFAVKDLGSSGTDTAAATESRGWTAIGRRVRRS